MNRRLTLRKEALAPLSAGELSEVAGGASAGTCYSCVQCMVEQITEGFYSVLHPTECCYGIPTFHGAAC